MGGHGMKSPLWKSFVERFGSEDAFRVLKAARSHAPEQDPGSDAFRWALLICVGYECLSRFADWHGFTCKWQDVKQWMKENAAYLRQHDGDIDTLSLACGAYDFFLREGYREGQRNQREESDRDTDQIDNSGQEEV